MINAIIFDVGGVLIRTLDHGPRRRLEEQLGLEQWESEALVFSGADGTAAQMGAITEDDLWRSIADKLALDEQELTEFQTEFWAGDALDYELVALIHQLREAGYQTAIISNATDRLHHLLSEVHQIAGAFDLIVGSAEEKVMKPEHEIYRRTLDRLGVSPSQAVFIDDNKDNIRAAREVGMHAIHFRDGLNVQDALARLGIDLPDSETYDPNQTKDYISGGQPHD